MLQTMDDAAAPRARRQSCLHNSREAIFRAPLVWRARISELERLAMIMQYFLAFAAVALCLFAAYRAIVAPAHDGRGSGPKPEKRLRSIYRRENLPIGIRIRYPSQAFADGTAKPQQFGRLTKTEIVFPLGDPDGDSWIEITRDDGRTHRERWADTLWEVVP